MKKLLYLLPILLILLSSCNTNNIEINNHSFTNSYNDKEHYQECECGDKLNIEEHTFAEGTIIIPSTCIEKGTIEYKCLECDYKKTEELELAPHKEQIVKGVEASCDATGLTDGKICSVCNVVLEEQLITSKTNHTFTEYKVETEPTCITLGKEVRECGGCGLKEYKDIPKSNHIVVTTERVESTCTTHGHTAGSYCDYCKKVFVETDELPLEDHNYGKYQEVTKATCISKGMDKRICTECGHEDFKETDILKHNYVTTEAVPSTCTIQGHTAGSYCSTCGKVETAEELLPLANHLYLEEYTVIKDATYISNGSAYYKCNNCDHTQNVEIPKLIFTKSNWKSSFNTTLASNTTIEMTFYDDVLNKDLTIKMINYNTKYYISIKDNNINIITYYYYTGTVAYQSLDDGYKHMIYVSSDDMYKKYLNILINSVYFSSEAYSITSEIKNGLTAYGTSKSYKNTTVYGTTTIIFNEKAELISLNLDYSSIKITANISYSSSDIALPYANYHDFAKGETCSQCSKTCDSYSAHKNNFTVYYHVMDSIIQFEYNMDNDNVTPCIFENPTMTKSTTEDIITFTQNYKDSNGVSQILYVYVVGGEVICDYDSNNLVSIIGSLYMSETDAGIKPDGSLEQIYFQIEDDLSIKVYYKGISDSLIEYEGIVTNIIGTKDEYYIIFENTANFLSYKIEYDGNIEISYA